jgi:hypothetical protein
VIKFAVCDPGARGHNLEYEKHSESLVTACKLSSLPIRLYSISLISFVGM